MKNFQKSSFILLWFVSITFTSCNNDSDTPEPEPTTAELILGAWETTQVEVRSDGVTTDFSDDFDTCVKMT